MEMSVFGSGTPTIGWADNERYFSVLRISPNNYSWTSTDPNFYIAPLTFTDPSGSSTGYVTCYYIGTDGNPYLAVSAEIDECP